jgi:hypothetical protein
MHSETDVARIVRSWLRTDEHESADRVLDDVLALLDATPQRRRLWPARRFADMNSFAKLAIAIAAVVVVAVVGFNLLPRGPSVGGQVVAPMPSPSPSPTQASSPSPTRAAAFPAPGPLAIGTHMAVLEGVPLSFELRSSGWRSETGMIGKGEFEQPDGAGINFSSSAPENVYADPCAHTPMNPPAAATREGLAAAVSNMPGIDVVAEPTAVTIDGSPGQYVAFKIREDIDCDPHDFYLWYDESTGGASGGWRWASALGALHRVWIVDVDGTLVWIDTETYKGAGPELDQEIQQIIDSIRFE